MRILLSTHSAATRTSFGIVCREIWRRIHEADPSLCIVQHGWFHHPVVEDVPWEILPTECPSLAPGPDGSPPPREDMYGDKTFAGVLKECRPDVVWHLGDAYMGQSVGRRKAEWGYQLIYYYPVGREPFNHFREDWVAKLSAADRLISATHFGAGVLRAIPSLRNKDVACISLGVDTQTYYPLGAQTRKALRANMGDVDDSTFVLGWVGLDQFRKQVWVLYEMMYYLRSGNWIRCAQCDRITTKEYDRGLRRLRDVRRLRMYPAGYDYKRCWYCGSKSIEQGRPREDVVLWTMMDNNLAVGYDLRLLAHIYDVGDVIFDSSWSRGETGHTFEEMSGFYNCLDALVFPSGAEGFGMPVLEAMACGVPVVYSNYSGHAEFAVGLPVRVRFMPDLPDPSSLALVDMGDLLRNVIRIMDEPALRAQLSQKAHDSARKMDWDEYTRRWLKVLRSF